MRALLEDMKTGNVRMHQIPAPELQPAGILVRTAYSAVSSGTERAKVEIGEKSLLRKALSRPDLVRQVINHARDNGIQSAIHKVQARLDTLTTLGYSCAGTVIHVGEAVTEFQVGDRVACAGGGYANHCEINFVPKTLAVRVPEGVSLDAAALSTIGAIAMQGLRQAAVSLGETVVVIGAGLLGVLAIQLARSAGCRVIAIDASAERAANAARFGAQLTFVASDPAVVEAVHGFSRYGADAVLVTAATDSAEPLELGARILRDRGRLVVVGDVGMGVSREHMYRKELSIVMSRSYGPGRYDPAYEESGADYPVGFVRWTAQRNMQAFLDLVANGALDLKTLLDLRVPVEQGHDAYAAIRDRGAYTAIIDYTNEAREPAVTARPVRAGHRDLRIGLIGAGGFARSQILPALRAVEGVTFESVATLTGVGAESARKAFNFGCAQNPTELIANPALNIVFIASRHDSHARYVVAALQAGKAVFIEKPLAVTPGELDAIREAYRARESAFLMVGFNRRFSSAVEQIQSFFRARQEPILVHVRVNAGRIDLDHWIHRDGGRLVGELCHFVDLSRALVDQPLRSVFARALPDANRYHQDNVSVVAQYADGSIANIVYVANGDKTVGKEYVEVFCAGRIARLDNFDTVELVANGKRRRIKTGGDKGHRNEIDATMHSIRRGGAAPIPFEQLVETTEAIFAIQTSIREGRAVDIGASRSEFASNEGSC